MKQTIFYPNPFILERADPFIVHAPDGYYYFTASYPAYGDVNSGYDRIILRRSESVLGLSKAKEYTIWTAHKEGSMAKHIWAPEIHNILGKWYIFFAAGDRDNIWNIRPYVLSCDGDPISDEWHELGKMQASSNDTISFNSFSLDMTYFEHNSRHYVIWAEIIGDSSLFMAEIDPNEPNKLITKPVMLTKPEFAWEKIKHRVNEGASVLKSGGRVYIFFSASGTGAEYCIGQLYADEKSELMDIASWTKLPYPVLRTEDLYGEAGPGHNSFVKDENGDTLLVYHSRPIAHLDGKCGTYCEESLYDPCRHTRIKRVKFTENGEPILK